MVRDDTVAATVDAGAEARFEHPERLPAGTVGVGIESDPGADGATWFDDLRAASGG